MIVLVFILFIITLFKANVILNEKEKCIATGNIYNDYLSVEKTNSIKGIFIIIVLFSHTAHYVKVDYSLWYNDWFNIFEMKVLGQSMVALFMFYSGYALMLCQDKKGMNYVHNLPINRIFKVLLHFDIAVLLYVALKYVFGSHITLNKLVLSLVAWKSIGNSNWYIFDILLLYVLTFIAMEIGRNKKWLTILLMFILTIISIKILYEVKESRWWDTLIIYPLGMLYYLVKDRIEKILSNPLIYYVIFILVFIYWLYLVQGKIDKNYNDFENTFKHVIFTIMFVMITMKISLNNKFLSYCGQHLFSIYILQRIPMIVLNKLGINNPLLFIMMSYIATFAMSYPFDLIMSKLDRIIFTDKIKIGK